MNLTQAWSVLNIIYLRPKFTGDGAQIEAIPCRSAACFVYKRMWKQTQKLSLLIDCCYDDFNLATWHLDGSGCKGFGVGIQDPTQTSIMIVSYTFTPTRFRTARKLATLKMMFIVWKILPFHYFKQTLTYTPMITWPWGWPQPWPFQTHTIDPPATTQTQMQSQVLC